MCQMTRSSCRQREQQALVDEKIMVKNWNSWSSTDILLLVSNIVRFERYLKNPTSPSWFSYLKWSLARVLLKAIPCFECVPIVLTPDWGGLCAIPEGLTTTGIWLTPHVLATDGLATLNDAPGWFGTAGWLGVDFVAPDMCALGVCTGACGVCTEALEVCTGEDEDFVDWLLPAVAGLEVVADWLLPAVAGLEVVADWLLPAVAGLEVVTDWLLPAVAGLEVVADWLLPAVAGLKVVADWLLPAVAGLDVVAEEGGWWVWAGSGSYK